jgi:hypothetical protein
MYEKPEARGHQGATDSEAIQVCAQWMRFLGAVDTVVADPVAQIQCDLYSGKYLAWVDNRRGNVGPELVNRVIDVMRLDGRPGLIFFRAGFDPWSRASATEHGISLLRFSPEDGTLRGYNPQRKDIYTRGLT